MPRRARHFKTNSIFHIGCRGVDRQPIYLLDSDKEFFLEAMNECVQESSIRTVAYCLMPNHFHWAIATADSPFDKVLHNLLTRHAVRYNLLHGRTGHLFEARHWSTQCEDVEHIENAIAYIHMNPVRAKLVRTPGEWRWSSYEYWENPGDGPVDFERIAVVCGQGEDELRFKHLARIKEDLKGGPKGLEVDELISDTASMLGISLGALKSGTRGMAYTLAKRLLINRAEREKISLAELARGLNTAPESLYMVKSRYP